MSNLTDPSTLSALAGVLLALVQLIRVLVAIARREPLPPPEAVDTPPQTAPPAAAVPTPV